MKNFFRSRDRMNTLRDAIHMSRSSEVLASIPDRLADVIARYDALPLDPTFRHDVYLILAGSLDVAEAVVDQTFSVETATEQIGRQMEVLARLITYMSKRPSRTGYTILIPASHKLIGQFGTEAEAESQLENLQTLGTAHDAIVVPCKILSQHVVQPRAPLTTTAPPPEVEALEDPPFSPPAPDVTRALLARAEELEKTTENATPPA